MKENLTKRKPFFILVALMMLLCPAYVQETNSFASVFPNMSKNISVDESSGCMYVFTAGLYPR